MQREPSGPTRSIPAAIPFIGRGGELALLAARFDEGSRLVTLLGPGGIGKTALAVEHATRRIAGGDRTSLVFCDLAGARDLAGVVDAMAMACGAVVAEGEADPAARVTAALAARGEVVVVIDNVDHLAENVGETILRWVLGAVEAEVLVTSRERLGVASEVVIEVGPLAYGAGGVDLLVAAAQKHAAGFVLRSEDAPIASELVTALEGVPLALELAAAWLPLFGARGTLDRVRASSEVLARDVRGGPARHASLDAAVQGSFDALGPEEREALAQLTVFRGGFTMASAEAVVRGAGRVAPVIAALRGRSLVRTRDAAAARFDLFASVRSFVERVHFACISEAQERHAAYFVDAAERAAAISHRDAAARAWLQVERENILAVATRVLGGGPVDAHAAEPALRGIVALCPLLLARGSLSSVAALVAPVVERTRDSGADPRFSARATMLRGAIRRERGDVRGALKDLLAAESIARALGDELLGADVRIELGRTLLSAGELAAAHEHFDRAVESFGGAGAREREAHALAWLAVSSASRGEPLATARALLERAAALAARDPGSRGPYALLLARACADAGDAAAARRALDDAVVAATAEGDARTEAHARVLLGLVLHDAGDATRAGEALAFARDLFALHGLDADAAIARGHLGVVAQEAGRSAEAYALLADAFDAATAAGRTAEASYFAARMGHAETASSSSSSSGSSGSSSSSSSSSSSTPPATATVGAGDLLASWPSRVAGMPLLARLEARAAAVTTAPALPDDALVVGHEGSWFRAPGGARVGLERRRSLALLLDRLATERLGGGATLTSTALFAAAWPGERALAAAASHRVRVGLATLRKMGLREAIVTHPDGYALATDIRIVRG